MNNRGSTTIIMIGLMPIVAMTLFFTLWLFSFMDLRNQIDNICYEYALQSQETVIAANQKIIALNPLAKTLHYSKKAIKAAIRRKGPDPILVAALSAVKLKQYLLRTTQEGIFTHAKGISIKNGFVVRQKISHQIDNFQKRWNPNGYGIAQVYSSLKGSKIIKEIKDTASTYKRKQNHERAQAMSVRWSAPANVFIPASLPYMKNIFRSKHRVHGECFSHPHERNDQWQAAVGKGNH